jgi:hypothetical protein
MWSYGLFDPFVKELRTTRYQFTSPFVLDSTDAQTKLGVTSTPFAEVLKAAGDALR